jgi:hypothetical protein
MRHITLGWHDLRVSAWPNLVQVTNLEGVLTTFWGLIPYIWIKLVFNYIVWTFYIFFKSVIEDFGHNWEILDSF